MCPLQHVVPSRGVLQFHRVIGGCGLPTRIILPGRVNPARAMPGRSLRWHDRLEFVELFRALFDGLSVQSGLQLVEAGRVPGLCLLRRPGKRVWDRVRVMQQHHRGLWTAVRTAGRAQRNRTSRHGKCQSTHSLGVDLESNHHGQ